jgi:hypothetical protein
VTGAPTHVEDAVQEIARLRAEHDRRASPLQRTVERFTARVGSPGFVVVLTVLVGSWIGLNCIYLAVGEFERWFAVGAVSLGQVHRRTDAARQVALFAWIPLLSEWFGNGEEMQIVLIALSASFR